MLNVAAAVTAAERRRARIVCVACRIANDTAEAAVHFKAGHLVPQRLNLVRLNQLPGCFALCVNRRCDVASVLVHLRRQVSRRKLVLAAAVCQLALDCSTLGQNAVVQSKGAVANAVADSVQPVVQLAELLAEQDLLLARSGGILAEFALSVPAVAVEAPKQEEQDYPLSAVAAKCAVVVTYGCPQVGK